jgi:hypothetical protein
MDIGIVDETVFVTLVRTSGEKSRARLLVESLRSFGGALSQCPFWLFEANPQAVPCGDLESVEAQVLPLAVPDSVGHYLYADKVCACARAAELATAAVQSLVFLAPENLVIQPPVLFDLGPSFDVAVRPVHIQNVGLLASDPLDGFWQKVYETVGVRDLQTTVESFVDTQHIRAYFNSAAFACKPTTGLFQRWFEHFEALVNDQEFQAGPCRDEWHQVFLHQAILSTLIASRLAAERIRILPPDYVYPYNLHQDILPERRARALNELVCIYTEGRPLDPKFVDDIEIHEPLSSWLASQVGPDRS